MKVSGQRNASVVLPPGIEGRCPLNRKLDGSYSVSGLFWTCNRWNFVCLPWRSGQHVPLKIQYNSTILDGTTNQNPTTFVVSHHKSKSSDICRQPSQIKIQRHLSSVITNQNPTTFVVSHHKSKSSDICRQPSQIKIQRHLSSVITNQNSTFVVSHHKSKSNDICRQPSQIKIQRHLSSAPWELQMSLH